MANHVIFSRNANNSALTTERIQQLAPAAFSTTKSDKLTDRYVSLNTSDIIPVMQDYGYAPVQAAQKRSRTLNPAHSAHMLAFAKTWDIDFGTGDIRPEIILYNSHDGSGSVLIRPIIERLFCHNQINKIYRATDKKHTYMLRHTTNSKLDVNDVRGILDIAYTTIDDYTVMSEAMLDRQVTRQQAVDYFKKVFPLPSKIEDAPVALLSAGEKTQRTNALNHRARSLDIYENSPTQENIRETAFGLWQAVVEYADHGKPGKSRSLGVRTMSGGSDSLKIRAQELALA